MKRKFLNLQYILLLLLWLLATPIVHSQYANLKFENLDTAEGLSSSTCTEIFQDSEGFLWFGTIDGLNRYDGYGFQIYRPIPNDPNSISNNRVNAITEDKYGNLWIGTSNGLNVFDKATQKFFRIDLFNDSSIGLSSSVIINDVLYDGVNGELWVATKNGMVKVLLGQFESPSYDDLRVTYFLNSEGKASPVMMRAARKHLGLEAKETIIIGDTMATDILGGVQLGYTTILTLSGVSKKEHIKDYPFKPDLIIDSVAKLNLKTAMALQ
ncbi:MAG: HAD hydrolase-like protein [Pricia sp.]|nr:HAD hydrolase-like protein [Pricia sp.]